MRVIGIGQPSAGDDGVGIAALRRLRDIDLPSNVALLEATEATGLIDLLQTDEPVILLDAVVGPGALGEVLRVTPGELRTRNFVSMSTHGVGVARAIALAHALEPDRVSRRITILGVRIRRPEAYGVELSPRVEKAVPRVVAAVLAEIEGSRTPRHSAGRMEPEGA